MIFTTFLNHWLNWNESIKKVKKKVQCRSEAFSQTFEKDILLWVSFLTRHRPVWRQRWRRSSRLGLPPLRARNVVSLPVMPLSFTSELSPLPPQPLPPEGASLTDDIKDRVGLDGACRYVTIMQMESLRHSRPRRSLGEFHRR